MPLLEYGSSKSVKARAIVEKVFKKGYICVRPCRDPDRREKGKGASKPVLYSKGLTKAKGRENGGSVA